MYVALKIHTEFVVGTYGSDGVRLPLSFTPGMVGFVPVFETLEQAQEHAKTADVIEIDVVPREEQRGKQ